MMNFQHKVATKTTTTTTKNKFENEMDNNRNESFCIVEVKEKKRKKRLHNHIPTYRRKKGSQLSYSQSINIYYQPVAISYYFVFYL